MKNLRRLIREQLISLLEENKFREIKDKYYADVKLSEGDMNRIWDIFSSAGLVKTEFFNWVLQMVRRGVPRVMEDLESAVEYLKLYDSNKAQIVRDGHPGQLVDRSGKLFYPNIRELGKVVEPYMDLSVERADKIFSKADYLIKKGEVDKIWESDEYVIYTPNTYNASRELACLTQWCTRFPDMYNSYSSQGPLYIILNKSDIKSGNLYNNSFIQLHLPSKQFKDIRDREVRGRKDLMNSLQGFYDVLFPGVKSYLDEKRGSGEIISLGELTSEQRFILPSEYLEDLEFKCGEIEQAIADDLGVSCGEVFEGEYGGYMVGDEEYHIMKENEAFDYAVDSILNSGLDDEWFKDYILRDYTWKEAYPNMSLGEFQDFVHWEDTEEGHLEWWEHMKGYLEGEWGEMDIEDEDDKERIKSGVWSKDLGEEDFYEYLSEAYGENPVDFFVDEMGYGVNQLWFVEWGEDVKSYLRDSYDGVESWLGSYDGTASYIQIGEDYYYLYRVN